ncbi:MAG: hypothetical protein R3276_04255 [Marinobacter sp.]|nr:hypothetical protein [Marinobacter sp.]
MDKFQDLKDKFPEPYVEEVSSAPWERDFIDEEEHWYSPFILWSKEEVGQYQPASGFSNYFAIGSNGGMETYFIHLVDQTIWVADLIAGSSSLEQVAPSFSNLLSLLECR